MVTAKTTRVGTYYPIPHSRLANMIHSRLEEEHAHVLPKAILNATIGQAMKMCLRS